MGAAGFEAAESTASPHSAGRSGAADRADSRAASANAVAASRGADATSDLPSPTAEIFFTAGAIIAERAARGNAERQQVEAIIARAVSQAGPLLATTVP